MAVRVLLLALAASVLAVASASAAELSFDVEPGATEETPFRIDIDGDSRPEAEAARLVVTVQREGEECSPGAPRSVDRRVAADPGAAYFVVPLDHVATDSGAYVACGWLFHDDGRVLTHARTPISVRNLPADALLTLHPNPSRTRTFVERGITSRAILDAGSDGPGRLAYVTMKPGGPGAACGPTFAADFGRPLVVGAPVNHEGSELIPSEPFRFDIPGHHLVCAWVQESALDQAPEAADAMPFPVLATPTRTAIQGIDIVHSRRREFWVSVGSAATGVPVQGGALTVERSPLETYGSFRFRRFGRAVSIARSKRQTICLPIYRRGTIVLPDAVRVRVRSGYGWRYRVRFKGTKALRSSTRSLREILARRTKGLGVLDEQTGRCTKRRPR